MRAGFGKWELTPPMGVELAGYGYYLGRCAKTVGDPLYAHALMIEDGDTRALLISCDLLGLSRSVCAEVFEHAQKYGCKPENVLIVSVHTHTGPTIKYHEGCGFVNDDYVATVGGLISKAIDVAMQDLDEVTELRHVYEPFEGDHIYNRTVEGGPVDRFVRGFSFERKTHAPIAAVSAACHGVFRGRSTAVSADFGGEICRIFEARGSECMYVNGLCGDIDPYKPTDDRLVEFAQIVTRAFSALSEPLPLTLAGGSIPFTLKLTPVTRDDIHQAALLAVEKAGGSEEPAARVALTWEREMLEKFDSLSDTEDIVVKYLILGGIVVVALPFEGFTKIGMDIRRLCGREDTLVLGCAEELLGYLPTRDDITRGAYAALESTFLYKRLPVVPGEAERLGEEMGSALKGILA